MGPGVTGAHGVSAVPPVITPGTESVMIRRQNTLDSLVLAMIQANKSKVYLMNEAIYF